MKKKRVAIDLNSKISELTGKIQMRGDVPCVELSFMNISQKTLSGIKFVAKGFDSRRNSIPVNDKDRFLLMVSSIAVPSGKTANAIYAKLPDPDIRQISLEALEYQFSDGSSATHSDGNWLEFDVEQFDVGDEKERTQLGALRQRCRAAVGMPLQLEGAWVCVCGTYNPDFCEECVSCGLEKSEAFFLTEEEQLERLVEEYRNQGGEQDESLEPNAAPRSFAWDSGQPPVGECRDAPKDISDRETPNPDFIEEKKASPVAKKLDSKQKLILIVIAIAAVAGMILLLYLSSPGRTTAGLNNPIGGTYGYGGGYDYGYDRDYGYDYGRNYDHDRDYDHDYDHNYGYGYGYRNS